MENQQQSPHKFATDPMMQQFLKDLDAYQRWQMLGGTKVKQPMPGSYSGGDTTDEALMRGLLERILSQRFAPQPVGPTPTPAPNYGAGTAGEEWK